ncbi:hypothetical protein OSH08_05465 [Kaistia geumhonensis]|uniref:Uncharacterized protein n=1 Tax=Kaistia geumhonensis TaxID=410839 RepID=A0ABU0M5U5_9HYPH|nr:hypothetical protein [Kaistia geumhonensis]MCX5478441.1 hypothetical protein [Kaistia geumhonensis]MDQ0516341.1 hypothetical protein [Kaistia geumhonensis]
MAATLVTKYIKDAIGGLMPRRVVNTSGTDDGPFIALQIIARPDGSAAVDLEALNAALVEAVGDAAAVLPTGAATQTTLAAVLAALQAQKTGAPADPQVSVGPAKIVTATLTRPADTAVYATGDLIANSTTAGSVAPMALAVARTNDVTGMVRKVRLATSNAAWANNTVRVHLFRSVPTSAVGDNGAFSGAVNGIASVHLGYFDVTFDVAFSDGAKGEGAPNAGSEINFEPAAGTANIYALLEVRGAYTPASGQTFALALEVLQN